MKPKLKVQYRKAAELIPYASNARTHTELQIQQIAGSIREFGFTNPILLGSGSGILAGHGRLLAAEKLGLEEVPTIDLSHLNEAQQRAYIIADNKLALNAGWDEQLLALELERLQDDDFNLEVLGFDQWELDALWAEREEDETDYSGLENVDLFMENTDFAVAKGDRWRMGPHLLICCDPLSEWPSWIGDLPLSDDRETIFAPFAGPYITLTEKAQSADFLVIQPDPYLASITLQHYADRFGAEQVAQHEN